MQVWGASTAPRAYRRRQPQPGCQCVHQHTPLRADAAGPYPRGPTCTYRYSV